MFKSKFANLGVLSAIVFLIAFLLYAKTINFKNTGLDDVNFVYTASSEYKGAGAFFNAFAHNVLFEKSPTPYYRPMLAVSFIADNHIAGESEKFSHFTNILLHAFSCVLLFLFLYKYVFSKLVSFLAAVTFAVFPIMIYTAAWIPGRNDSIFFIAFILALIFFIRFINDKKPLDIFAHILFLLICFFTRESALIIPAIFVLYAVLVEQKKWSFFRKKEFLILLALWICSIIFFTYMRKFALHIEGGGFPSRLNLTDDNIGMTWDYYASVFFLRSPFAPNTGGWITVMGIISFLVFAFFIFATKDKTKLKRNIFYFLLPLFFILPALISERLWFQGNRMYVAMFGFIVLFYSFLSPFIDNVEKAKQKIKIAVLSFVSVLLIVCCILTFNQMNYFNGQLAFWGKILSQAKRKDFTIDKFYAYALMQAGRPQEAVRQLLPAANALRFSYNEINYALGQAFLLSGDFNNAIKVYQLMVDNKQMEVPQVYASIVIGYAYLNDQKNVDIWIDKMAKTFNISSQAAVDYIGRFNQYLRSMGKNNA